MTWCLKLAKAGADGLGMSSQLQCQHVAVAFKAVGEAAGKLAHQKQTQAPDRAILEIRGHVGSRSFKWIEGLSVVAHAELQTRRCAVELHLDEQLMASLGLGMQEQVAH